MLNNIITGVIVTVVGAFFVQKLGLGNTTTTVYKNHKQPSKVLGIIFVLGWLMFYLGGFYGFSWALSKGFDSPQAITGLAYWFLGFIILVIRKVARIFNGN